MLFYLTELLYYGVNVNTVGKILGWLKHPFFCHLFSKVKGSSKMVRKVISENVFDIVLVAVALVFYYQIYNYS